MPPMHDVAGHHPVCQLAYLLAPPRADSVPHAHVFPGDREQYQVGGRPPGKDRVGLVRACLIYYYPMNALTLTQTTPLFEDKDGTIRIVGSRIPLDTIVYEFNQGATAEQIQDSFPSLSLRSIYGALAFYLEHQAAIEEYLRHR